MKNDQSGADALKNAATWAAAGFAVVLLIIPNLHYADVRWTQFAVGLVTSVLATALSFASIRIRERIRRRTAPKVFISYSHEDSRLALEMAARLKTLGVEPIIDRMELSVGDDIEAVTRQLVEGADYYLALLSPAFKASSWAQRELEVALKLGKKVLPILLVPDAIPEVLRGVYYADFTQSADVGYEELARTFKRYASQISHQQSGTTGSAV